MPADLNALFADLRFVHNYQGAHPDPCPAPMGSATAPPDRAGGDGQAVTLLRQPLAHVTIMHNGIVTVAVRCNFDHLADPNHRDAVHAVDRADAAMIEAAGGHRCCYPMWRDVSKDPPGYVFRVEAATYHGIESYAGFKARSAWMALAAVFSLEADGYEVRESTPESRLADLVGARK
jgi:hypothetical protein